MKKEKRAFETALDGDPKVRAALIERMTTAAQKAPIAVLHQICQMLELDFE